MLHVTTSWVRLGKMAVVTLLAAMFVLPVRAIAAPDDPWDPGFFRNGGNDGVRAVAVVGSDLYVGGDFTTMFGVPARRLARFDGVTWSEVGGGVNAAVHSLAVSGGDLYVGGDFGTAGATSALRIARWNGTAWSALGTGMNSSVRALTVVGTDVYAGGAFTTAGGVSANRIARWDGSVWSALGTGMDSTVHALASSGTTVFAGGEFGTAGGVAASRVARWDGATWSALTGGGVGFSFPTVRALATSGSDLYVGGNFATAGPVVTPNIARWNSSSGWSALGGGVSNAVQAIVVSAGSVYAGGVFQTASGTTVNNIARWDGSSWSALGSGTETPSFVAPVFALAAAGSDLYAGGFFASAGGAGASSIARWDGASWSAPTTTVGQAVSDADPSRMRVSGFLRSGDDLYAAGFFHSAGSAGAWGVARWDGSGWSRLGAGIETNCAGFCGGAGAMVTLGTDLYVGGAFTIAGGGSANHIARWNGTSWSALGSGMGGTFGGTFVAGLATLGSDVFAGGQFSTAGGVAVNNIARWNGTTWSALGSGITGGFVTSIVTLGSDLYIGGNFTTAGGASIANLARWDGSTFSPVGGGINGTVNDLVVSGTDLYAGGVFTNAGGVPVSNVARWNGTTWSALGASPSMTCTFCTPLVNAITVIGTDVYVGGNFTAVSGVPANTVAKFNGTTWSALGSGIPFSGAFGSSSVHALASFGSDVFVGGIFGTAGGKDSARIALWRNCGNGVVNQGEQCDDGNLVDGDCCSGACGFETGGGSCADDGNPCTNDQCDGAGGCAHPANTAPCSDGVFCNGLDTCSGSTCSQHAGNPCPGPDGDGDCAESCDEAGDLCTAPDADGSACVDGAFCNGVDTCTGGVCAGHAGDPCVGADGDGNCAESCDEGNDLCTAADPDGSACTDGVFCNGADTCNAGLCAGHAGDPCAGGSECANVCNEAGTTCALTAGTPCSTDGNVCTDDECNGTGTCAHAPNTAPCDDALYCNGSDVCAAGACTHAGDPCAAGSECATTCLEATDQCLDPNGTACTDDGNPCTVDQCDGGGACAHPAGNAGVVCRSAAGACDVAETCDGAAVACPSDVAASDGTTCNDGDACTTGESCTSGSCTGGLATVCALCETCDSSGGCLQGPRTGCKRPTLPGKAKITLKNVATDTSDLVTWKWSKGPGTTLAELGAPISAHDYGLCIYAGSSDTLVFRAIAPAGDTCGTVACWRAAGSTGFKYGDKLGTPDGLQKILVKSGLAGRDKASIKGKGVNLSSRPLGLPVPPLATPLRVQLQSENGTCFESVFSAPTTNQAGMLKAKGE
jgi:trimeric autotransporter adhesin